MNIKLLADDEVRSEAFAQMGEELQDVVRMSGIAVRLAGKMLMTDQLDSNSMYRQIDIRAKKLEIEQLLFALRDLRSRISKLFSDWDKAIERSMVED